MPALVPLMPTLSCSKMKTKSTHGGKREGAGRKPAPLPLRTKKFRASEEEWQEFLSYLMNDATGDFDIIIRALRIRVALIKKRQASQ